MDTVWFKCCSALSNTQYLTIYWFSYVQSFETSVLNCELGRHLVVNVPLI